MRMEKQSEAWSNLEIHSHSLERADELVRAALISRQTSDRLTALARIRSVLKYPEGMEMGLYALDGFRKQARVVLDPYLHRYEHEFERRYFLVNNPERSKAIQLVSDISGGHLGLRADVTTPRDLPEYLNAATDIEYQYRTLGHFGHVTDSLIHSKPDVDQIKLAQDAEKHFNDESDLVTTYAINNGANFYATIDAVLFVPQI